MFLDMKINVAKLSVFPQMIQNLIRVSIETKPLLSVFRQTDSSVPMEKYISVQTVLHGLLMLLLWLSGAYPYSRFCNEHAWSQSVLSSSIERNLHTAHRIQVMVPSGVEIRDLVEIDLTQLKDLLLLIQPEGVQPLHLCYGAWDSCDHHMCCYSGHCC